MKTKIEIRDWIIENCLTDYGIIDLTKLDFSGYAVFTSKMKANFIGQSYHEADDIWQCWHKAKEVHEGNHTIVNKQEVTLVVTEEQLKRIKKMLEEGK